MSVACEPFPTVACAPLLTGTSFSCQARPPRRHPRGLYAICMLVLSERFAAYTLISTVALMLCERYGYQQAQALRIVGLFNALSYLGTLGGGLVADRVLGYRRTMAMGLLCLLLGYCSLSLSSARFLSPALGLLVLGCALFKPSMQSVVAQLYPQNDPRLDGSQIILYLFANGGAMLGSLVAGMSVRYLGYASTYRLAAFAVALGSLILWMQRHSLRLRTMVTSPSSVPSKTIPALSPARRLLLTGALAFSMLLFTLCTAQAEGALLLFAQRRVDREILGFVIPLAWFIAYPALLALILGPVLLASMHTLQRRMGTYTLVAIGLVAVSASFGVLIPMERLPLDARASMFWFAASLTLFVVGELCVAPLGLSLLQRITPPRFAGVIVGVWYAAGALGHLLAGEVGALWTRWPAEYILGLLVALPLGGAVLLATIQPRPRQP